MAEFTQDDLDNLNRNLEFNGEKLDILAQVGQDNWEFTKSQYARQVSKQESMLQDGKNLLKVARELDSLFRTSVSYQKESLRYNQSIDIFKLTTSLSRNQEQTNQLLKDINTQSKPFFVTDFISNNIASTRYGQLMGTLLNFDQFKSYLSDFLGDVSASRLDFQENLMNYALSTGISYRNFEAMQRSIQNSVGYTAELNVGFQELIKFQNAYNNVLGTTRTLRVEENLLLSKLRTGLGITEESAANYVATLQSVGLSLQSSYSLMQDAVNFSELYGINASKVVESISQNLSNLQKFQFRNGIEGIAKMAVDTKAMKTDMNTILTLADKFRDINRSIETVAELQLLGGAFTELDPLSLMNMAREDVEQFNETITKAIVANRGYFNQVTGEIKFTSRDIDYLASTAQKLGMNTDELQKMATQYQKINAIKQQNIFLSDEEIKRIVNIADFDTNLKSFVIPIRLEDNSQVFKRIDELKSEDLKNINVNVTGRDLAERTKDFQSLKDMGNISAKYGQMLTLTMADGLNKQTMMLKENIKIMSDAMVKLGVDLPNAMKLSTQLNVASSRATFDMFMSVYDSKTTRGQTFRALTPILDIFNEQTLKNIESGNTQKAFKQLYDDTKEIAESFFEDSTLTSEQILDKAKKHAERINDFIIQNSDLPEETKKAMEEAKTKLKNIDSGQIEAPQIPIQPKQIEQKAQEGFFDGFLNKIRNMGDYITAQMPKDENIKISQPLVPQINLATMQKENEILKSSNVEINYDKITDAVSKGFDKQFQIIKDYFDNLIIKANVAGTFTLDWDKSKLVTEVSRDIFVNKTETLIRRNGK